MNVQETTGMRELSGNELDGVSGAWLVTLWSIASSAAAVVVVAGAMAYGMSQLPHED
jgi:hypothetical protein